MFTTTKPKMASIVATSSQHSTPLPSKSCEKCRNIYDSLSNHLLSEHTQTSVTDSILNNVLLNILSLLSGNATGPTNSVVSLQQAETLPCTQENMHFAPVNVISKAEKQRTSLSAKDHVASNTFASSGMNSQNSNIVNNSDMNTLINNTSDMSTRTSFHSDLLSSLFTSLPQVPKVQDVQTLPKILDVQSLPKPQDLQQRLPKIQDVQTSNTNSRQHLIEPKLLQVQDSLDISFMVPPNNNFPPAASLIAPDGSLTPAGISFLLASQSKGSNSGKSDLDVADILVNKMPIPSLNKALDPGLLQLSTLYLQQLAMNSQNGLSNNTVDFTSELMNMTKREDSTSENMTKSPTKSVHITGSHEQAESIQQLIARHKQISGLIEVLSTQQKNAKKNQLKVDTTQYDHPSGSLSTYTINPQGVLASIPNISLVQNNRNAIAVSALTIPPPTIRQAAPTSTIKTNPNSKSNVNMNSNKKSIPIIWDQVSTNLLNLVKQQVKGETNDAPDFDEHMADGDISEDPNVDIKQNDLQAVQNIIIENPKSIVVVTDSKNTEEFDTKSHFSPVSVSPVSVGPVTQFGNVSGTDVKNLPKSKVLYKCNMCGVTFSVISTLQAHLKTHIAEKKENCNYCHLSFTSKEEYYKHVLSHRGEENVFTCQYCQKIFTSKGDYSKHVTKHTQRRPYICSHCQKAFRDPGSLTKHERIHTGEQPYICEICDRGFAEKSSLRKHVRVHSGEQPYKCKQCDKSFSISGNLQRHLFIHTGLRPFKCTQCSKAFNNPSHLRRHVKNLHGKIEIITESKPPTNDSLVCPRGVSGLVPELHTKEENIGNTLHIKP